jgi:hypothetical protein
MEVDVDEVIDEVLEAVGYAYKEVSDEHVRVSRGKQAWSGSSLAVALTHAAAVAEPEHRAALLLAAALDADAQFVFETILAETEEGEEDEDEDEPAEPEQRPRRMRRVT